MLYPSGARFELGVALLLASALAAAATQLPDACKLPGSGEQAIRDSPNGRSYGQIGARFAEQGDLKCALAAFEGAVRLEPASAQAHYNLGVARARAQRWPAAAAEFRLALHYKPGMARAHDSLGALLMQMGDPAGAEAEFRQAMRLDPNSVATLDQFARWFVAEHRFATAVRYWKRALALEPGSPEMALSMGIAAHQGGDPDESIRILRELIKAQPNMKSAHSSLGEVYLRESRFHEAADEYAAAVRLDPGDDLAWLAEARALVAASMFREARAPAEEYVRRKPSDPEGHSLLASVETGLAQNLPPQARPERESQHEQLAQKGREARKLLAAGQPARAAALYRQMLEIEPGNARTEYQLARAFEAAHDAKGRREALERAVRLDPRMAAAQGELGRLDLASGSTALAEKRLDAAIGSDPHLVPALVDLGTIRAARGDVQGAEKLFRQAVEDDPNDEQGYVHLGQVLATQRKFAEAEAAIDQAVKLAPRDAAVLAAAGRIKAGAGKGVESATLLRQAIALAPQSVAAHLDLGMVLAESHDMKGALAEDDQAVRLAPESALAHLDRGRVLLDLGRDAEARDDLESARRIAPGMAEPYYFLAVIEKQADHYAQAAALLQTAVKLQPRNAAAWNLLGQSLDYESQTQAAIAAWRQAVAIEPDNSQALWSLARAVKSSDPGEAARLMARYSRVQRERHVVDEAGTLGNEALAAGAAHDWPEAIRRFRKAIEVCGDCAIKADLHKKLGLTAWQMGDIDGGEKELRLAQALKPGDPDLDQALERIAATRTQRAASHPGSGPSQ